MTDRLTGAPFDHTNNEGDLVQLSGKPRGALKPDPRTATPKTNWVTRKHPDFNIYFEDEKRMRASFLATRRHLAEFLVPHRFEGDKKGEQLRRSNFGFGIGLNKAFVGEQLGNVRAAATVYNWGPLGLPEDQGIPGVPSEGTLGSLIWNDATGTNKTWPQFIEQQILEWMLTSVGGFILIDTPARPEGVETLADAMAAGFRPRAKWIPQSAVWDYAFGSTGYRWIKIAEVMDLRQPMDQTDSQGRPATEASLTQSVVLYELLEDGTTQFSRWNLAAEPMGPAINLGRIEDAQGQAILPLVPVLFGEHPDIEVLGAGTIFDLADIIIDLFNVLSETRESFRDAAFSMDVHAGPDHDEVKQAYELGSRLVPLGDNADSAKLERLSTDAGEVTAGMSLIELGIAAWALAARRKAADARMEAAQARSGVALQAEFQLDMKPLLVQIAGQLDMVESQALNIMAQLFGESPQPGEVGVERDTEFQLEEEAARISRIITEFLASLDLPPTAKQKIVMRWIEHSRLLDLEEEVTAVDEEGEEGETRELREVLEDEVTELFQGQAEEQANREQVDAQARAMLDQMGGGGLPAGEGE